MHEVRRTIQRLRRYTAFCTLTSAAHRSALSRPYMLLYILYRISFTTTTRSSFDERAAAANPDGQSYRTSKRKRSSMARSKTLPRQPGGAPEYHHCGASRRPTPARPGQPGHHWSASAPRCARWQCVLAAFSSQQRQECI
ncbi:hypothetical protein MRX96_051746 [Rhipicephalus microplus]